MITPPTPINESERLEAVKYYNLVDTLPEKDYESITELTAAICDVPIALVTIMDSDINFLKSHYGLPFNQSPRNISFCGHAIVDDADIFIVEDARKDPRFVSNPIVKEYNTVFYAGVKLTNSDGYTIGTLCVFDTKPRILNERQKMALKILAKQVMNLFEARRKNIELEKVQKELNERNEDLLNFAGIVSHDLKMPLSNIILTADMLRKKYEDKLDDQAVAYFDYLKQSSFVLSDYISSLLQHYQSDHTAGLKYEEFDLNQLLEEVVDLMNINYDCEINLPEQNVDLKCNRIALEQILLNLVGNSLKYNFKEKVIVSISCEEDDQDYTMTVSDNGMGISEDKLSGIFDLFSKTDSVDRNGNRGKGIGLSTVKKLIERLGGTISVTSEIQEGTTFVFTIPKKQEEFK